VELVSSDVPVTVYEDHFPNVLMF